MYSVGGRGGGGGRISIKSDNVNKLNAHWMLTEVSIL